MEFTNKPPLPPAIILREHSYPSPKKTVVVIGMASGGTSCVAAVVDALGIPIIHDSDHQENFEDDVLVNGTIPELFARIKECNSNYDCWGFKNPHLRHRPAEWVHRQFCNPFYIVVAKDVASMSIRNFVGDRIGLYNSPMASVVFQVHQSCQFWSWCLELPPAPMLLVSYYEMLKQTELCCSLIADFLSLSHSNVGEAVSRVSPTGGYFQC